MDIQDIQNCIEELLQKLTLPYTSISIEETDISTTFHIETDDAALLIGTDGETLHAFSYIVRKIMYKKTQVGVDVKKLTVDVNNYEKNKIEQFKKKILETGEKVRIVKQPVELNTMTSYERMIVHSLFTNDDEISTHSEGVGKSRKIILTYKSA